MFNFHSQSLLKCLTEVKSCPHFHFHFKRTKIRNFWQFLNMKSFTLRWHIATLCWLTLFSSTLAMEIIDDPVDVVQDLLSLINEPSEDNPTGFLESPSPFPSFGKINPKFKNNPSPTAREDLVSCLNHRIRLVSHNATTDKETLTHQCTSAMELMKCYFWGSIASDDPHDDPESKAKKMEILSQIADGVGTHCKDPNNAALFDDPEVLFCEQHSGIHIPMGMCAGWYFRQLLDMNGSESNQEFCCAHLRFVKCIENTTTRFCTPTARAAMVKLGKAFFSEILRARSTDACSTATLDQCRGWLAALLSFF